VRIYLCVNNDVFVAHCQLQTHKDTGWTHSSPELPQPALPTYLLEIWLHCGATRVLLNSAMSTVVELPRAVFFKLPNCGTYSKVRGRQLVRGKSGKLYQPKLSKCLSGILLHIGRIAVHCWKPRECVCHCEPDLSFRRNSMQDSSISGADRVVMEALQITVATVHARTNEHKMRSDDPYPGG
jgi:hypothetical protein